MRYSAGSYDIPSLGQDSLSMLPAAQAQLGMTSHTVPRTVLWPIPALRCYCTMYYSHWKASSRIRVVPPAPAWSPLRYNTSHPHFGSVGPSATTPCLTIMCCLVGPLQGLGWLSHDSQLVSEWY